MIARALPQLDTEAAASVSARIKRHTAPDPNCGCLLWTAQTFGIGYGRIKILGRSYAAHRVTWELSHGPIPAGMLVCHRCDTPACVRPDHLFLGTAKDNTQDMLEKGRHQHGDQHYSRRRPELLARGDRNGSRVHPERVPRAFGEKNHAAKLSDEQVARIRVRITSGEKQSALAAEFGVHKSLVSLIASGKRRSLR